MHVALGVYVWIMYRGSLKGVCMCCHGDPKLVGDDLRGCFSALTFSAPYATNQGL